MVKYEFNQAPELTEEEKEQLKKAENMPIIYDDDCPELTEQMAEAFKEARRKKPYRGETLTLHISKIALEKAKTFGEDYIPVLEQMLDEAIREREQAAQS